MQPTEQQITDTEVALSHWWCGTDFSDMEEDDVDFTEDALKGAELLDQFDDLTIELLTLWRGYLHANEDTGVQPSVEDFILATYVVNRDERR
jgi:hypothetical protein